MSNPAPVNLARKAELTRQVDALLLRADAEEIEADAIVTRCEERIKLGQLAPALAASRRTDARARRVVALRSADVYRREAVKLARQAEALPGVLPNPMEEARRLSVPFVRPVPVQLASVLAPSALPASDDLDAQL